MLGDEIPAQNLIDEVTSHQTQKGRRYRAFDPTGKDRELFELLGNPRFKISGLTNKMLRQSLVVRPFGARLTERQLSTKVSRHFRLFRVHGIIRRVPKRKRYQLRFKGIKLTNLLDAFLAASTEQLMKMAA